MTVQAAATQLGISRQGDWQLIKRGRLIRNYLASAFLKGATWGIRSCREGLKETSGCLNPMCEEYRVNATSYCSDCALASSWTSCPPKDGNGYEDIPCKSVDEAEELAACRSGSDIYGTLRQ